MDFISGAVEIAKSGYLGWIFVFIILTAFEFLNARGDQKLRGRVNGLAYWTSHPLSAVLLGPHRLGGARSAAGCCRCGFEAFS